MHRQLKDYPDYEISSSGKVRKIGEENYLSEGSKRGKPLVGLRRADGTRAQVTIPTLFDDTFPELVTGRLVKGFPDYKIHEDGELYSLVTHKTMKPNIGHNGYRMTNLRDPEGEIKVVYIHRLVAEAFVDGYFDGAHVNHIDGNKLNNNYTNLEWCTNEHNLKHAWSEGLNNKKLRSCKISLDGEEWLEFESLKEAKAYIEKEVGCTMPNVSKLSLTAKKNDEKADALAKNEIKWYTPHRCRGYIVRYT